MIARTRAIARRTATGIPMIVMHRITIAMAPSSTREMIPTGIETRRPAIEEAPGGTIFRTARAAGRRPYRVLQSRAIQAKKSVSTSLTSVVTSHVPKAHP